MRRIIQFLLLVSLSGVSFILSSAASPPRLDMPGADTTIANPVPLSVVKAVARYEAKRIWGEVAAGNPIPCVDQNGKLTCHMVPFRIGGGKFPDYSEIMKEVEQGRKLVKDVREGFLEEGARSEAKSEPAARAPDASATGPTLREDVPKLDPIYPDYHKALKAAKAKEIGAGRYGTIFVSASYEKFPIPHIAHYLPPFYVTGDLAKQKADEALNGSSRLSKIYFLGLRGTYFEFALGGLKKTIHAHSLEVKEIERTKASSPPDPEAYKARMAAEWKKLKEAARVKEGGNS